MAGLSVQAASRVDSFTTMQVGELPAPQECHGLTAAAAGGTGALRP